MGTNTRLPGMENMPEAEYKKEKAKELAKYHDRLNAMCPLKELRFAAKEITMTDNKCDICEYRGKNCGDGCHLPYADAYIEALEIDICYEGVLMYLSEQMDHRKEDSGLSLNDVENLLENGCSNIYVNLKTITALCGVITDITKDKKNISLALIDNMYSLLDTAQEIIESWENGGEYGEGNDYDDNKHSGCYED